ncbi:MAG: glycoside hydrolase family 3 C-terminal domain-containing protein, partial [Proteobacteria bacterium]|nr:glycoside hydrolase family 3 C-terminal domain-containing protein [Pseudomonadota bacterium]
MKVAQVTADEGRALHNEMMNAHGGSSTEAAGVNCFSPNVNVFRDPRWGRGQETYGEDPFLVATIGNAYTHGLQIGEDTKYLKIAACAKSYVVHSGPEELRLKFTANVTLHDLYDTYLPAFKTQVVGAKVAQIMPAYSGLRCDYQPDGAPDAANTYLLKTVLREKFNAPNISIVSDNGAVSFILTEQKYVSSPELAAAVCMNATTDLDLGHDEVYPNYLKNALDNNEVDLETIRDAVVRNFYLRMRVGDFDSFNNSYNLIDKSHLGTTENQNLNLLAARKSIVLLKNSRDGLPLDPQKISNLAVIGPNANATHTLLSNYEGIPFNIVSILEGIKDVFIVSNVTVNYAPGCADVKCETTEGFSDAVQIAKSADYVIMVMGLDKTVEAEGRDRVHVPCG